MRLPLLIISSLVLLYILGYVFLRLSNNFTTYTLRKPTYPNNDAYLISYFQKTPHAIKNTIIKMAYLAYIPLIRSEEYVSKMREARARDQARARATERASAK